MLYYGKQIKHSLIKPRRIRFNELALFDNNICDDELYIEMDEELNVPMKFKVTKCIFLSRVPIHAELDTCRHFDMTIYNEWNPDSVNIRDLRKISQLSKR